MTTLKKLCIHGHFYQPPRLDPWIGDLLPEGSAAPELNWNQRILKSSYAPLAWARRKDALGRITKLINCYEWISFNCGPTLLSWLESAYPDCYFKIIEADRQSVRRWGHGNAMAQCYHHIIMPLASPLDKQVQLIWTKADFATRFGRDPEGLWLPETAVDTATLEAASEAGFRFVILAPGQAAAVADLDGNNYAEVTELTLDINIPYTFFLPSGRSIAVFFYHGPLSRAVAFERLLENGESFWHRLKEETRPGITALATDGETYGHHFSFGEMALAYVLEQAGAGRDGLELTNFAAYLADHPPLRQILLREPSSWSCTHGVERWRADCGCTDGGKPGWSQQWRAPLRQALEYNKKRIDAHFFTAGYRYFVDPRRALLDYGRLPAAAVSRRDFVAEHFLPDLPLHAREEGFDLLAMQEWAMCSLASCAWFFAEITRVEPLNAMAYALRAMELAQNTGAEDWTDDFSGIIASAVSNLPDKASGAAIWHDQVLPRRMSLGAWAMLGLLLLEARGMLEEQLESKITWPNLQLTFVIENESRSIRSGKGILISPQNGRKESFAWHWQAGQANRPWSDMVRVRKLVQERGEGDFENTFTGADLAWNRRQLVVQAWLEQRAGIFWQCQKAFASGSPGFFLKWQEDQFGPNREFVWLEYLPGLAWAYLISDESPETQPEFLEFLRSKWRRQELLEVELNRRILELLAEKKPDWFSLGRIADRIRDLGVAVNLWAVENRIWDMDLNRPEICDLAVKLGFRGKTG